jgi:hypothetical protein
MFIPDPNFTIPDPEYRVKKIPDPGSRSRIRIRICNTTFKGFPDSPPILSLSAHLVDIGMPDFGEEPHRGRIVRVVVGELQLRLNNKKAKNKKLFFLNRSLKDKKLLYIRILQDCHGYTSSSVADPGCLSRIPDPDFYPSRIPDPGSKTATKERGENKLVVIPFYVATNLTKL